MRRGRGSPWCWCDGGGRLRSEGTGRTVGWSRGLARETTPFVRVPGPAPSSPLWLEPARASGGGGGGEGPRHPVIALALL